MPMTRPDDAQVAELARLGVEPLGSAPAIERYLRSVLSGEPILDAIVVRYCVPTSVCDCGLVTRAWFPGDGWSGPLDHCEPWRTSTRGRLWEAGVDLDECVVEGVGVEFHFADGTPGAESYLGDLARLH